ncbi:hypothetical protein C8R45DRAFT_1038705 [Mycena sanguinolenta]|nr:hypothetical protein C8R45DRAFT_1038705 [Mycena sanguinolenta]
MEGRRAGPPPGRSGTPIKSTQTGSRRPRSPEPALHAGERALDSTTKSPHTNRIIKRGKTATIASGSSQETITTTPDRTHATHVNAAQPATTTPTPFTFAARPPGLIDRISEQIQSSVDLAARITVKPNTDDVQPLVALIQRLLDTLTTPAADLVALPHKETKQTKTPTYAEATKAPQQLHPPKGAHHASQARLLRTSKYGDRRPRKTTRSTRLVLDFSHSEVPPAPPPANLAPPAQICAAFNKYLPETRSVKAVTRTRNGNWILHTDPDQCTAHELREFEPDILKGLQSLRSRLEPGARFADPLMHPAEPWHSVVIHGIPQTERLEDFVEELSTQNRFEHADNRLACAPMRLMWPRDKPLPPEQSLTMRLSFLREADANRFIRQGMFLFGTLCRVSKYKPRRNTGR